MKEKELFDSVSLKTSKLTTRSYSTSFSLGTRFLHNDLRGPIYALYGFVRYADEIVDSFHDFDKATLLKEFWSETYKAIDNKISLNPILNSFQHAVHAYGIEHELIDTFMRSMEMDLSKDTYTQEGYEEYILGSAEVVGLMCLRIFCRGDKEMYTQLKPFAMKLGSAFQKINFLRDLEADYNTLGRTYFPGVDMSSFDKTTKREIEEDIAKDFAKGFEGIKKLPKDARFGVYVAYVYYFALFKKIRRTSSRHIMNERIRIPNQRKYLLFLRSYVRHQMNLL